MSYRVVPSWVDVKAAWTAGWTALSDQATRAHAAAIQANPAAYLARVTGFTTALTEARAALDRMAAKIPNPPVTQADKAAAARQQDLERRYHDLAAGFYADAEPVPVTPSTGVVPVLIVGAVAVGVVGVAFAVVGYEYAVNLREQTALAEKELDARVVASREGRTLAPSTLPPSPTLPTPEGAAKGIGMLLVGGLVLTAGALAIPAFLKR